MINENENGISKLYDALNKKAVEMAEKLNSINLKNIDLEDPKNKEFDRVRAMWNDCAGLVESLSALREASGESPKKAENKGPFVNTIAQDRNY